MQGRPTLIVLPINIGSMLHQELNHVKIIIDAGLQKRKYTGLAYLICWSRNTLSSENYATEYFKNIYPNI